MARELREFSPDDLEDAVDVDRSTEFYASYQGQLALVAETLRLVPPLRLREIGAGALELVSANEYDRQEVTVSAPVAAVIDERSFTLLGEGLLEEKVLVVRVS